MVDGAAVAALTVWGAPSLKVSPSALRAARSPRQCPGRTSAARPIQTAAGARRAQPTSLRGPIPSITRPACPARNAQLPRLAPAPLSPRRTTLPCPTRTRTRHDRMRMASHTHAPRAPLARASTSHRGICKSKARTVRAQRRRARTLRTTGSSSKCTPLQGQAPACPSACEASSCRSRPSMATARS